MAGAICTAQGLRSLLNNSCSHILFATADTLVSPQLFLHLPPHVPLSQDAMDTGTASSSLHSFRFRTPAEVSLLVQSTFSDQLSHTAACRASVTEVDLQDAHFPLYCTPYYGYSPTTSVDLQVEILQLSNHLVSSLSLLSSKMEDDSLPTPSNLLSVLAVLYPHLLHVSPGEGLLLSPFTDPDTSDQPQPCWLNRIGGPAPPTFPKFLTLEQSLTAYSSSAPMQMFLKPLPLGPSACVHLNPGLLPPPLVNSPHPPLTLSSEPAGGWGAVQYYFHFRPDSTATSLTQLTPELHQLPSDFSTSILSYEQWAAPEDLFQVTPPPPQNPLRSSQFLARNPLPTPPPTMASPFVTGRHPRATSCGPSLAIPDYHHQYTESTGLWTTDACHTPDCGSTAIAFYLTTSYWASHPVEQLSADNFATPVAAAFSSLHGLNRFGLPDYFVAPHSLFTSTVRILLKLFRGTDLLVEGFGPGAYSGAVITNLAFSHANFQAGDLGLIGRHRNAHPYPYLMPQSLQKPSFASGRRPWCLHNRHAATCITSPSWPPP